MKLEEARLSQAQADLERSRLTLEELQIRSPVSGFVAERNVEVGDLARAEDILLRIVDLSTVRTVVNVVERDYGKVRVGQQATIRVDAVPAKSFPGIVVSKAPVLDPGTRTARVMIEIRNPDLLLRPGMHARVTIVADRHRDALVIPLSAMLERDGEQFVFEVDADSTARRRTVSTGIRDGDVIEVRQGLSPESRVITLGSRLVSWPLCSRNERRPVTNISRPITAMTIHEFTPDVPDFSSRNTNAPQTMILSTNGSRMRPNVVTSPYLRAMYPSRKSVAAATANSTADSIQKPST